MPGGWGQYCPKRCGKRQPSTAGSPPLQPSWSEIGSVGWSLAASPVPTAGAPDYIGPCDGRSREEQMGKPRIFLGSSGKQAKPLQALTRGLSDVAVVEPWTTSFNPGVSTMERLMELTREVDFAVFIFAQDDWSTV